MQAHDQTFKKFKQFSSNFYMSNLFQPFLTFRPRFDVNFALHAPTRELEIWSGSQAARSQKNPALLFFRPFFFFSLLPLCKATDWLQYYNYWPKSKIMVASCGSNDRSIELSIYLSIHLSILLSGQHMPRWRVRTQEL